MSVINQRRSNLPSLIPPVAVSWCLIFVQPGPDLQAAGVLHQFNGITAGTNNTVTLQLDGAVSNLWVLPVAVGIQYRQMFDTYFIEASPDLTQWTRRAVLFRTIGDPTPLIWQDTNAASLAAGFYRTPTNYLITPFPKPSGPYGVGKVVRILTDPSRTNRSGIPTNSSFMSTIWYPADPPAAGSLPGLYTDSQVARDVDYYVVFGWYPQWRDPMASCVTVAYTNVAVVAGTNRFPVIVHSHGIGADRTLNSQIIIELASHGYIVAAVDHEDCHCTVYPDARGARYAAPGTVPGDTSLGRSRTNDMEVLLGALAQFDGSDPILAGRLDLSKTGAMGDSWGGGTAGEVCRNDSRVKCAALLDPAIFVENGPNLVASGLQKPFLTMNDTVRAHTDLVPSPGDFSGWSSNLFYLATTNATWFKVTNATHLTFEDRAWTTDTTTNIRNASLAIDASALWFFDTYLKGETPPFPTNAEIINVQRK